MTFVTFSVEADCGRNLKRINFPSQGHCCVLIFQVLDTSIPIIKVFDSISAVEKLGEVVKSMTCVLLLKYCLFCLPLLFLTVQQLA